MNQFSRGIGIIEGFYGEPWSFQEREHSAQKLQTLGGSFYTYAPKGDPFLRKRWKEAIPQDCAESLKILGRSLHEKKLSFGVGLSPYELYRSFDLDSQKALEKKLIEIKGLGADHLALLFDDMRGDLPNLATLQIEIINFVQKLSFFKSLSFCPTYYSTDPILDKVFGQRPEGYLEKLSNEVDEKVDFYWTGEKVCSTEYSEEHLEQTKKWLGRFPLLWDNYPVNDGQRMCKHLHLKSFTGRPASLKNHLSGHAINPMNQEALSWIPMLTLFQSYAGETINWMKAATTELGETFAKTLEEHVSLFKDEGLDKIEQSKKVELIETYQQFKHPAAQEIISWLKGETIVTRELVLTQ